MEDTGRLTFWEALYLLSTNPSLLYAKIGIEKGIWHSLFCYSVVCAFVLLVSLLANALFNIFIRPIPILESNSFLLLQIGCALLSVILLFLYATAMHLVLKGLGGVGTFEETFRITAYCTIPTILLSLIPVFGFVTGLLISSVLVAFGLRLSHNVSTIRAAFAVAVPIAALTLLLIMGIIPLYLAIY
jgi:hypothetical protein